MMVIGDLLTANARRIPEREAIVCGDERVTWAALNASVNRLANGLLQAGAEPGDRIAFIMSNSIDVVRVYYAIAKAGCTAVPILPRSVGREVVHVVESIGASCLIASADQADAVRDALTALESPLLVIGAGDGHGLDHDLAVISAAGSSDEPDVEVAPESLYAIQFTSGTTGSPKGCMLRHDRKLLSRMSMLNAVHYSELDRALVFMPLTASLGADMLHSHVLAGAATVIMTRFDAGDMLRLIAAERISVLYAMESTYDRLMEDPAFDQTDWSSLRYMFGTGAGHNLGICARRFAQVPSFSGRLWNAYGCTEGGGWLTFAGADEVAAALSGTGSDAPLRSIGREIPLARVDCVDADGMPVAPGEAGEMILEAPWLFTGYWGLPDKTADALRGNRYFTGDIARKDAQGYITLEGRMTDMIKTGGINVYPAEIEMVLMSNAQVREASVIGVPDAEWGEKVIACIISDGHCDEAELLAYCKKELAGFKVPKQFEFVSDFPRDNVGKILKKVLREQIASESMSA